MIMVRIGEEIATIRDDRWAATDRALEDLLNGDIDRRGYEPSGGGNMEWCAVSYARERFPDLVIVQANSPVTTVPGRIY